MVTHLHFFIIVFVSSGFDGKKTKTKNPATPDDFVSCKQFFYFSNLVLAETRDHLSLQSKDEVIHLRLY